MKFYALIIAVLLIGLKSTGQQLADLDLRSENGVEKRLKVVHDNDDNYFIAGETYIPVGAGGTNGPTNIWIEKHAPDGQTLWTTGTSYTLTANDAQLQSIDTDQEGNLYVSGAYVGTSVTLANQTLTGYPNFKIDFFVAKLNPQGEVLWFIGPQADLNPDAHRIITSARVANDGGVLLSGTFYKDFSIGGMQLDGVPGSISTNRPPRSFIAKLNSAGEAQWVKPLINLSTDQYNGGNAPAEVLQSPTGNLFIRMWLDSAVVIGTDTIVSSGVPGNEDLNAVVKTDETGNVIDYVITRSPYSTLRNLELDNCGNPLILGTFMESMQIGDQQITASSNRDVYVAKFDADLNCQWLKKHGSGEGDQARGLYFNDKNEVFFTFEFWGELYNGESYTPEGLDLALVKLDAGGELVWNTHTTGTGLTDAIALSVNSANQIYTFGTVRGEETFGQTTINTPPGQIFGLSEAILAVWNDDDYSGDPVDCDQMSAVGNLPDGEVTFSVYPNPVNNRLFVELRAGEDTPALIEIVNLQGKVVKSKWMRKATTPVDVSDLPGGLYVLKRGGEPESAVKFVKR